MHVQHLIHQTFGHQRVQAAFDIYNIWPLKVKAYWLRDAPTGLTVNNCTLCPHCIYVFCIYLRTNSDLCHLHHKLIGFYN